METKVQAGLGEKPFEGALPPQMTDLSRWRLRDDDGCHTWHFLADESAALHWPQSDAERSYLGMPLV